MPTTTELRARNERSARLNGISDDDGIAESAQETNGRERETHKPAQALRPESYLRSERRPQPIVAMAQPIAFCGTQIPVMVTLAPTKMAKGEMVKLRGRVLAPDWTGEAPRICEGRLGVSSAPSHDADDVQGLVLTWK